MSTSDNPFPTSSRVGDSSYDVRGATSTRGPSAYTALHLEQPMGSRFVLKSFVAQVIVMMVLVGALTVIAVIAILFGGTDDESVDSQETVILISFDGFRHDYFARTDTPNLDSMRSIGVSASNMRPIYPSSTFPNHYTLVTGLYAESHGIVENTMYDPVLDATFSIRDSSAVTDSRWWLGEPVWVTAAKAGLATASFYWPGSEANITGYTPTYFETFNFTTPFDVRTDMVLDWLDLPIAPIAVKQAAKATGDSELLIGFRPSLITLYFDSPDTQAHEFGVRSQEVTDSIGRVDAQLGRLYAGLVDRELEDRVNVVVVSDHGMTDYSQYHVIFLEDYVNMTSVNVVYSGALLMVYPIEPLTAEELVEVLSYDPHLTAWLREDVPTRFHFTNNRRITPVVAAADGGYRIVTTRDSFTAFEGSRGIHGYDNENSDMQAILVAQGPAFANDGHDAGVVANIHLYEVMCSILHLEPAPNNGSLSLVSTLLR